MSSSVFDENETNEFDIASISSSQQMDKLPSVYKVGFPLRKSLVSELSEALKETLFTDDPLRPYKDQTRSRQFVLGLESLFPILKWGREYNLRKFKGDFLAHAAIVGFMGGIAITIVLQQLKGLLGIQNFTRKTDIISVMHSVWGSVHHNGKKKMSLFWVPAIAPLISKEEELNKD